MKLLSALAVAFVLALSSLVLAETAGGDLVNATCPITGKSVDGELYVEHGDARSG